VWDGRFEAIEAYQATLDELAANQRALDARVADQRQRQETLERQQAKLIREREERKRSGRIRMPRMLSEPGTLAVLDPERLAKKREGGG